MESENMTLVAAILVVGLMVGAGVGYYMAPAEIIVEKTQAPTYTQPTQTQSSMMDQKLDGISTLVYGAIAAALVSALASIITLMQMSRRYVG